ncbi:MAG TPA: carboxypeptidase regulatory-like domain-containing protein [Planctomycetes bacterium]|nr:carboxypeptidase regulatory-like domain-containing protein [Planctomycetota bacterium]
MRSAENVENFIKRVCLKASAQMHERTLNDALEAQEKSRKTKSAKFEPNICRIIMKSPITKLAAAAVIIVAVLIGISTFNGTTAWAKVIKALGEVENIYIVSTMTMPDGTQVQCKWWLRRPNCLYEDVYNRIVIDNGQERLTIDKENRTAQFSDSFMPYNPLEEHHMFESINRLRGESSEEVEFVKLDDESDETTLVFSMHCKHSTTEAEGKAWVDALTMLPRKIQVELISESRDDNPKSNEITCNYEPIADDVFAMVIPEGFTELPRKQRGVMSGRVLDEHEQPVANAIVFVTDRAGQFSEQTITNESGHFTFKLPPEGVGARLWLPVLLRAFVEGVPDKIAWSIIRDPDGNAEPGGQIPYDVAYIDNDGRILKSANGITLRMEPAGTIAGQVTDVDGAPIPNAKVKLLRCEPADKFGNSTPTSIGVLRWDGPDELGIVQTDENGRYELNNLLQLWKRTRVVIHAEAEGFVSDTTSFRTKGPIEYEELDLQLYRAGLTVSGVVVDNYGELLREREVYARVNGKDYRACRTKTDKKGRFRLVGCPITQDLQVKAELSHNHWPPHEKERYMSYRYYADVVVGIDYDEGKMEYEVEIVAERPEITIEVELKNTAGEPLPYFPVEVRGAPATISSQWRADKKLDQRTDERGYCRFTKVPNVESLRLVMWGGNSLFNDILSKEEAQNIEDKYKKYKWTEVPVELIPGRKEYKVEVTILTSEKYEQKK